ncbi:NAD-dependent DNA ligase LigA, partial [Candidatus Falkowbacteria bacterium]|nr:NAD-dependent DNA ligase LigA [Candidatus Falkowbacteria bacterium]
IGSVVAKSIYDFWHDEKILKLLEKFIANGFSITVRDKSIIKSSSLKFSGQIFVLTGTLNGLTRSAAADKI